MNPKIEVIFVHTIIGVIFKYMLQVKDIKHLFDNNVGILSHMKTYYGCYEWKKKWQVTYAYIIMPKQFFDPNTFIQTSHDNNKVWNKIIKYLIDTM
jgi:hypothetical protein